MIIWKLVEHYIFYIFIILSIPFFFVLSLPVITLNIDILVKLVDGFWNRYENRLISGSVAHEKATSKLSINPVVESKFELVKKNNQSNLTTFGYIIIIYVVKRA